MTAIHFIQVWLLIARASFAWQALPHCERIYDMDPGKPLPPGIGWEEFYGSPAYSCTAKLARYGNYFCVGPNC